MINVYQKNDQFIRINIDENGQPVKLNDFDICFVVSDGIKTIFTKNLNDGIEILDTETGLIEIAITSNDSDLPVSFNKCEVVLIDVVGHRYTVFQDKFNIVKSYAKEC